MLLPALAAIIVFHYIPMYGLSIAFKDLRIGDSLLGGKWVGLAQFKRLFASDLFGIIFKNTIAISLISHILLWPLPIVFALLVHNSNSRVIRKFTQTGTYLPHLLSVVVVVSIIELFCSRETGVINILLNSLGFDRVFFLGEEKFFLPVYFVSNVWTTLGASAVVYLASLSSVDPQLLEAATIDGAGKFKRMWHVDLPAIRQLIILLFIMNMGHLMNVGYEKVLLMQNDLNLGATEIIGTYVYKTGILGSQYSFSAAVSLFNNGIGLVLVLLSNWLSKRLADTSLF
jgi:putative aldouronate transport system permease protein